MTPEERDRLDWEYSNLLDEEYRLPYAATWCVVVAAVFWVVGVLWIGVSIWRGL